MNKEEQKKQREERAKHPNNPKTFKEFYYSNFYQNILKKRKRIYDDVISESPENLGYNEPTEYQTTYSSEQEIRNIDRIHYNNKFYDVTYNDASEIFYIFINEECVADLQIGRKNDDLYVGFPWQHPDHKGLMRFFYKYLLENGFHRIISSNYQSENAFRMWKKMAEEPDFNFYVLSDKEEKLIGNPKELDEYFGPDKQQYKFAIELKK